MRIELRKDTEEKVEEIEATDKWQYSILGPAIRRSGGVLELFVPASSENLVITAKE